MDSFDEFFRRMRRLLRDFDREFERVLGISGFKIEIRGEGKPREARAKPTLPRLSCPGCGPGEHAVEVKAVCW